MFRPIDSAPASWAPRLAASMTPGPPPVMIVNPASPSSRAVSRAAAYTGSLSGSRAEPKIEIPAVTWASASNAVPISWPIAATRSGSLSSVRITGACEASSSSSGVNGGRGRCGGRSPGSGGAIVRRG